MQTPKALWMLAGLVFLAGCSRPAGEREVQSTQKAAAGQYGRDACSLLDTPDIEAIFNKKLAPKPEGQSKCMWMDAASGLGPYLMLTVSWEGGRENLEIEKKARGIANRLMNEPEAEGLTKFGPVPNLGDEAYLSKGFLASYVLKGDTLLEFQLPLASERQLQTNFVHLAKKALSRLPTQ
jgi:hypothetical protein